MYFLSLRRSINTFIRTKPSLFFPIMRIRPKFRALLVSADTEIVIEGYPRSANTFAVAAFEYSQDRKARIARHTHAPAQIMEGARFSIPIILLVRNPQDAVVSLAIRDETMTVTKALIAYIWYHEAILDYIDNCVVADFSKIVNDYSRILNEVNMKFNKNYALFEHDKTAEDSIFRLVEAMEMAESGGAVRESHVARPSEARREIKGSLLNELSEATNARLLQHCEALYEKIIG